MEQAIALDGIIPYEENSIKAWAYFHQGLQDEQEQRWQSAALHYDKASSLMPRESCIYAHLAWTLLHLDLKRQALNVLALATQYASQEDYLIYFDIGNVYRAARQFSDAKQYYQRALEIFPEFQKANQAMESISSR